MKESISNSILRFYRLICPTWPAALLTYSSAGSLRTRSTDGSPDLQPSHLVNRWMTWPTVRSLCQQMDHGTKSLLTWSTYGSWPTACLLYQQMDPPWPTAWSHGQQMANLTNSLITWSTARSPDWQLAHTGSFDWQFATLVNGWLNWTTSLSQNRHLAQLTDRWSLFAHLTDSISFAYA
jgi:hypothetical protein